jgi:cobalt-zinc-cadmium efflux system protein
MGRGAHDHRSRDDAPARRLRFALGLSAAYMAAEFAGGIAAHSLALLADAGHMLSDVVALSLALFATRLARRPATPRRTYGYYRAEILAALVNGASLLTLSVLVAVEAVSRLAAPSPVSGPWMMAIGAGGLGVNLAVLLVLRRDRGENLNFRAAWLHAASDALGSVQVLVAGAGILLWGLDWLDPVASLVVSGLIVRSSWTLLKESVAVLFESAPTGIDVDEVRVAMSAVEGVRSVHDLHVWTIGTGLDALSAHVASDGTRPRDDLLREIEAVLRDRFRLRHTTVQVESEPCATDVPHA